MAKNSNQTFKENHLKPHVSQPRHRRSQAVKTALIVGMIAAVSAISGAAIAKILSSKPLNQNALSRNTDPITGTIPTNLDRPINVLVLGTDNSGSLHPAQPIKQAEGLAGNTDTMLLVRLDPKTYAVNILSIPRDTQVDLPGGGLDKINDANAQGGVPLAINTVSQLLNNIPIDRYVRLDTQGFIQLVDALGGIEMTIPKRMDYSDRTQNLQIHFSPGKQKLNGQHLQEYVRFRYDELGDIGRVQRQQVALKAIFQTLVQPASVSKIPQILEVAKKNVDTDLSLGEMLATFSLLQKVNRENIHMLMLPGRFSRPDEYPLSYWIGDPATTSELLTRYFDVMASPSSEISTVPSNLSVESNPNRAQIRIAVVANNLQPEIAQQLVTQLQNRGFYGTYLSDRDLNANSEEAQTTQVIAEQGNPEIAQFVQQELGIGQIQVSATGDITSDVTIIVGADAQAKSYAVTR